MSARIRLTLKNQTSFSGRDLRRFLLAGLRHKGIHQMTVSIIYGRGESHHGRGAYNVRWLQLRLPSAKMTRALISNGREPIDILKLGQILEHEIDHTNGLKHHDMIDWWTLPASWTEGLSIAWLGGTGEKASPEQRIAASSASREQRAAHARSMLRKAETRLKRAKTIHDKWARRVRRYEV